MCKSGIEEVSQSHSITRTFIYAVLFFFFPIASYYCRRIQSVVSDSPVDVSQCLWPHVSLCIFLFRQFGFCVRCGAVCVHFCQTEPTPKYSQSLSNILSPFRVQSKQFVYGCHRVYFESCFLRNQRTTTTTTDIHPKFIVIIKISAFRQLTVKTRPPISKNVMQQN